MNEHARDIPYSPEDRIFPSVTDNDLWISVLTAIQREYPERALAGHVRQAFETVCEENDAYMPFKNFLRKVRLIWLWKRPPAPRGMLSLE